MHSELYSHIILIPFIAGYLVWLHRHTICQEFRPAWITSGILGLFGLALGAALVVNRSLNWPRETVDYLCMAAVAFWFLVASVSWGILGAKTLRPLLFPLCFLSFMAPFPGLVREFIETVFQYGSATAASVLFPISGIPVLRDGMNFYLPGFALTVAPECSGIHSTFVLFITSLLAGHLLLQSRWRRVLLVMFVLPLALLRNGVRIVVLGNLCVRVSPDMINSYIHRKGGPIFFALSLVPFFLFLLILRRSEGKLKKAAS